MEENPYAYKNRLIISYEDKSLSKIDVMALISSLPCSYSKFKLPIMILKYYLYFS